MKRRLRVGIGALVCLWASAAWCADVPASSPGQAAAVEEAQPAVKAPAATRPLRSAKRAVSPLDDAAGRGPKAQDRLELDASKITGTRELPKVMAVVPWKRSDIGDLAGRPMNSLVDEALQPVDREVFRREVSYYKALDPDRPKAETRVTGPSSGSAPEK